MPWAVCYCYHRYKEIQNCGSSTWFLENEKNSPHFPTDTVTIVLYQKNGKLDKTDFVSSIKKQSKIFDVKKIEKVTKQRI